jgi:hypothetical protein
MIAHYNTSVSTTVHCTIKFNYEINGKQASFFWVGQFLINPGHTLPENLTFGSNQTVKIVSIQSVPPINPGGPPIKLTVKNIGMSPITSLNAKLELNHDYYFDFREVTQSTPLESGSSISETSILIGAGYRSELTFPITITGIINNIPFTYTENIHMP